MQSIGGLKSNKALLNRLQKKTGSQSTSLHTTPLAHITLEEATFVYSEILDLLNDFSQLQQKLLMGKLSSHTLKRLKKRLLGIQTNDPSLKTCIALLDIRLYLLEQTLA